MHCIFLRHRLALPPLPHPPLLADVSCSNFACPIHVTAQWQQLAETVTVYGVWGNSTMASWRRAERKRCFLFFAARVLGLCKKSAALKKFGCCESQPRSTLLPQEIQVCSEGLCFLSFVKCSSDSNNFGSLFFAK